MSTVGERVRRIRVNKWIDGKPMSAKQLSDRTDIDETYILRIERGKVKQPGIVVLERLAEGLEVKVEDIAPPGYYQRKIHDTQASVESLIWADTTLTERAKAEAVACVRQVFTTGRKQAV